MNILDVCDDEGHRCMWCNWKHELVDSRFINWRQEVSSVQPDEGDLLSDQNFDPHDTCLVTPTGKLFRDMTREEIQENWQDVSKAEVKEIAGLSDFGCSKRCLRHKSNNIIDAR